MHHLLTVYFFKISSFVFKKKLRFNFYFWVNYPFMVLQNPFAVIEMGYR